MSFGGSSSASGGVAEQLSAILTSLRRVVGVRGAIVASRDGLVIFHSVPRDVNYDRFAAMAAAVVGTGEMSSQELGQGTFERCLMEAARGKIVYVNAGREAILTTLVERNANLGLVMLALQRAAGEVKEVLETI